MASGTSGICLSPAFPPKAVSGVEIYSPDRGIYQIKEKENSHPVLKDFTTLMPEKEFSPNVFIFMKMVVCFLMVN